MFDMYYSELHNLKGSVNSEYQINISNNFQKIAENHSQIRSLSQPTCFLHNFMHKLINYDPILIDDIDNLKILFKNPTALYQHLFGSYNQVVFQKPNFSFSEYNQLSIILCKRKRALQQAFLEYNQMVRSFEDLNQNKKDLLALTCCIFTNWYNENNISIVLEVAQMLVKVKNPSLFFSFLCQIPDLHKHVAITSKNVLEYLIKSGRFSLANFGSKCLAAFVNNLSYQNDNEKMDLNSDLLTNCLNISEEYQKVGNEFSYLMLSSLISFDTRKKVLENFKFQDLVHITVNRKSIVNDVTGILISQTNGNSSNIKITFKDEQADDNGGPRNEFFNLFMKKLMENDDYFIKTNKNKLWFNGHSKTLARAYRAIGQIIGLAFLNRVTLPFQFANFVWKFILQEPPDENDLLDIDEHALELIKEMRKNADQLDELDYRFVSVEFVNGKFEEFPIVINGENIRVTKENVAYFVAAYIDYRLASSVYEKITEFREGFISQTKNFETYFTETELSSLISVDFKLDWSKLSESLIFEGFNDTEFTPYWMLEILSKWDDEKRIHFLEFVTGLSTPPESSFQNLKIYVQKGADPKILPFSHTCANSIVIPEYRNIDILESKLLLCLSHSFGFGFK